MSTVAVHVKSFFKQYPIVRGIISYAVIWPVSSICQQSFAGKNWKTYDWAQAARFSLYGSCFVAPTLYGWIRISSRLWPRSNLKTAVQKALVEQVSYGPAAMICFFFGMSLLEGKNVHQAKQEVQNKFLPTYKVGVCVWPILQTINFAFVSEKNRVPYVSMCSLMWTCFLAYMKHRDHEVQQQLLMQQQNLKLAEVEPKNIKLAL